MINNLCSPAILYVGFSLIHIIIDTYKELYYAALFKFFAMILFTIILNLLCERGLGIISWVIVFIPFIFMTIITTLLLFVFGMNPKTGKIKSSTNLQTNTNNIRPASITSCVNFCKKTLGSVYDQNNSQSTPNADTIQNTCVTQCNQTANYDNLFSKEYENLTPSLIPSVPQSIPPSSQTTISKDTTLPTTWYLDIN